MKVHHKIRNRLMFGFAMVALLPALTVGIYSIKVSSGSLVQQELNAQKQVLTSQSRNISSFLANARGDVEFLAGSVPLRQYLGARRDRSRGGAGDPFRRALEQEFLAFANSRGIYYQLRYLDETGQEVVRIDADRFGQSAPVPVDKLQNQASRYYFSSTMALSPGGVYVSPLDLNREKGQIETPHNPVIRYAVPVRYPDGGKAGIVITNIHAVGFLVDAGEVMLTDSDGFYLANPNPAKAWGSQQDLSHGANLRTDFPDIAERAAGQTKEGSITTADRTITYLKLPVPGSKTEWLLVLAQPTERLLASVREFQRAFWVILVGTLATAIFLAAYIGSKITRPIELLTSRAEKVSMGELLSEVKVDDQGEIGQLAAAFERMRVAMVRVVGMLPKERR